MKQKFSFITEALSERKDKGQLRTLQEVIPLGGVMIQHNRKERINFSSNDYLGLSMHPDIIKRATEYLETYGMGATASRLVCGNYACHEATEEKLADLKESEKALIFNAGFQANATILPTLADSKSLIFADRLNHNSLLQGALLSQAKVIRYRHNDLSHLTELLEKTEPTAYNRIFIVTESVFSMDGDCSDVDKLIQLSDQYEAFLILDEAHATGVFGKKGMGMTAGKQVDLSLGTFGKALGSFGAYVTCSQELADYLINFCPGFIYTTAPSPAVMGAIDAALELVPQMENERQTLLENADLLRKELKLMGLDTGDSSTQIIPIIIGEEKDTLELSRFLEEKGILGIPIRPPTVPKGKSRLRLSLSVLHQPMHLEKLLDSFRSWLG